MPDVQMSPDELALMNLIKGNPGAWAQGAPLQPALSNATVGAFLNPSGLSVPPSSAMVAPNVDPADSDAIAGIIQGIPATVPLGPLYERARQLSQQAVPAETEAALQAKQYDLQADEHAKIADWLKNNPYPAAEHVTAPNVAPLDLPSAPRAIPNSVNPVAQIAAGIAGLFDKHGAGAFSAAALDGAIKGTQQINELNQARYKDEVARLTAIHRDIVDSADRKLRVDVLNSEADNRRTVQEHSQLLDAASETAKSADLHGMSDALKQHERVNKPSAEAAAQLSQTEQEIKQIGEQNKWATETRAKLEETRARITEQAQIHEETMAAAAARQKEADATRLAVVAQQQAGQNARNAASIASRQRIAAGSQALQEKRISIMRELGANRKGTMFHPDPDTKAAESRMNQARQRLGQVEKEQFSTTSVGSDADKEERVLAAEKVYDTALDEYRAAGHKQMTGQVPPAAVKPPTVSGKGWTLTPR